METLISDGTFTCKKALPQEMVLKLLMYGMETYVSDGKVYKDECF
jgi:hypothetical protein